MMAEIARGISFRLTIGRIHFTYSTIACKISYEIRGNVFVTRFIAALAFGS